MRVLVVHQNFPGQFGHFVSAWSRRPGWDVRALGRETCPGLAGFDRLYRYRLARKGKADQHPYLRQMEEATLHGQAAARAMLHLKQSGFTPDVILAHPGWGETLYAKDIYPDARLVHFAEWYYHPDGADMGFDPEFPSGFDDKARIRTWNALHALNMTLCDVAVSPTRWQRSRFPVALQSRIEVQHEGLPTHRLMANPMAKLQMPNGTVFKAGDPIVTYVARNLEPYRGFHVFMRAMEQVQRRHPRCHAVIVGGDDVSYGRRPARAASWREQMLSEVKLDPNRTHFLGRVPYETYLRVLQISAAHVYLTYPFVLSWSLLEAMACGAFIIGSDTAPVCEMIQDGQTGSLVDFFKVEQLSNSVLAALEQGCSYAVVRANAMRFAQSFNTASGLAFYDRLVTFGQGVHSKDIECAA